MHEQGRTLVIIALMLLVVADIQWMMPPRCPPHMLYVVWISVVLMVLHFVYSVDGGF